VCERDFFREYLADAVRGSNASAAETKRTYQRIFMTKEVLRPAAWSYRVHTQTTGGMLRCAF